MFSSKFIRGATLQEGAWKGAWKRLFVGQSTNSSRFLSTQPASRWATQQALWRQSALRPTLRSTEAQLSWNAYGRTSSKRGFRFSAWRRNTKAGGEQAAEKLSLSQRLKKLSKEYGWSAVGVYLALSVLDFPFCFLLVRIVGTDTIGKIEHYIVSAAKSVIPDSVRTKFHEIWATLKKKETESLGNDNVSDAVEMAGWGVEQAQERNTEEASLGTQLALAYAIHKSFIFIRVPLTAAILPKVVKVLRSWGWNIGKRTPRA